ncbi:MAG: hypothetical protein ACMXYC_00855 [Candidatus Woesearchaeota archaeon]
MVFNVSNLDGIKKALEKVQVSNGCAQSNGVIHQFPHSSRLEAFIEETVEQKAFEQMHIQLHFSDTCQDTTHFTQPALFVSMHPHIFPDFLSFMHAYKNIAYQTISNGNVERPPVRPIIGSNLYIDPVMNEFLSLLDPLVLHRPNLIDREQLPETLRLFNAKSLTQEVAKSKGTSFWISSTPGRCNRYTDPPYLVDEQVVKCVQLMVKLYGDTSCPLTVVPIGLQYSHDVYDGCKPKCSIESLEKELTLRHPPKVVFGKPMFNVTKQKPSELVSELDAFYQSCLH